MTSILFLGTGTSTGVPSLCCDCAVCHSEEPRNKRLRASVLIRNDDYHLLIDTSTDLRQQCLNNRIGHINAVLYTHHHADHLHGIDELRSFNYFNKTVIPIFGRDETLGMIRQNFGYIFNGQKAEGGGKPQLTLNPIPTEPVSLGGLDILPLNIEHGRMIIYGYRIGRAAYITDCSRIPEETREHLLDLDLLAINALGYKPHPTHMCLEQALQTVEDLKPKRTYLTHINHTFDHYKVCQELPENVSLAYDGLELTF